MSSPQLEIKRNMKKGFKKCITALTPATLLTAGLVSGTKKHAQQPQPLYQEPALFQA